MIRLKKTYSDEALVDMIRQGGIMREQALSYIMKAKNLRLNIKQFVCSNRGNVQDSEDLYMDTIVMIDRKIRNNEFELTGAFFGYLFNTAKYTWMNRMRRKQKMTLVEDSSPFDGSVDPYEDEAVLARPQLTKALEKLGERCKTVLKYWMLDYPMEEIAEIAELSSPGMARKTKYKCLKKLKETLGS